MGQGIARRILGGGHDLVVYNRTPEKSRALADEGARAAGPPDAVRRCEPLFQVVGRHTFDAGPRAEGATAIKLANNFLLGCAIEAMGEAFSLVRKYGVAPEVFYDVMTDALFAAPAYKV